MKFPRIIKKMIKEMSPYEIISSVLAITLIIATFLFIAFGGLAIKNFLIAVGIVSLTLWILVLVGSLVALFWPYIKNKG
jgi:uncharacterized membrane protein YbhN (UPF0104 family)